MFFTRCWSLHHCDVETRITDQDSLAETFDKVVDGWGQGSRIDWSVLDPIFNLNICRAAVRGHSQCWHAQLNYLFQCRNLFCTSNEFCKYICRVWRIVRIACVGCRANNLITANPLFWTSHPSLTTIILWSASPDYWPWQRDVRVITWLWLYYVVSDELDLGGAATCSTVLDQCTEKLEK